MADRVVSFYGCAAAVALLAVTCTAKSSEESGIGGSGSTPSANTGDGADVDSGTPSSSEDAASTGEEVGSGDTMNASDADAEEDSEASEEDSGGTTVEGPAFEVNGRLAIEGSYLVNQFGYPIQLRGMSSHGLQWYENCLTPESLDVATKDWDIDVLRSSVYVQEGGYETKPEYFRQLVDRLVGDCHARGIYCMVDWHQLNPGDPNRNLDLALEFFEHVASSHADKGNVIYEICNEPSGVDWADIKRYAEQVIPVIRKHDPDSVIVVGTPRWASNPHLVLGDELEFDNIMYTVHFYAGAHGQEFRDYVEQSAMGGLAVFATEFGTQMASGDGPNDFAASEIWLELLAKHKISWTNWNYSDDKRSGAVWREGSCRSGSWSDDDLKPAGAWIKQHMLEPPDRWPID